ncbi:FAD-dependent oxidoreductase [Paenibacillus sp. 1001270B_150601_E10]|uniref:FAD-dependent oxidoreductase n=1 Tax=Paenibacillus sp. 1001270B_150601_E10 TaxID=2787079 RepID=UPI002B4C16A4|nr:FAD-dependent oxidoreductase [Paenibacillus sp. 1001270B_150601_E10]
MFRLHKGWLKNAVSIMMCFMLVLSFVPMNTAQAAKDAVSCGKGCLRYDVVVIGSEIQGIMLARAAQREGKSVLVLDPRTKPGGELIQGQMMVLDQPNNKSKKSLVQGELKNLFAQYQSGSIRTEKEFNAYYQKLIKGLPLRSGIQIVDVKTGTAANQKTVQSLSYLAKDGVRYTVQANYWVENTDHNALVSKLDDKKRIPGMESLYNGKQPDYMAATYMLKFKNVNWNRLHAEILKLYPLTNLQKKMGPNTYVDWNFGTGFSNVTSKYKPQDSQLLLRGLNMTYQKDGEVIINGLLIFDVNPSDPNSVQQAVSKGKKEAPHVLKFLQKNIPGFEKAKLNGYPEYLYIRDYNRYETKYVLTENDVLNSSMHWDNVSIGGYPLDLQGTKHMPLGNNYGKPDQYGIPLRSFLLKSYDNVIMAGKNVGATIKAYGSARIMPNTGLAAETIGIIIGRESSAKRLHQLTQADFKRIHRYLAKEYRINLTI